VRECAGDDREPVRAGAAWCLRFLREELDDAEAALRRVAGGDPNDEIRATASDAVESAER
jgi:hypothetical protein